MRSRLAPLLTALLLLLASAAAGAELRIASWNVEHLGWDNAKSYPAVARVASQFDLLALQEVMAPEAVAELERALEAATQQDWGSLVSHAVGDGYQEHYAFIWREAAVAYVDGAVVYVDDRDAFAREPFSARFRDRGSGEVLAAATVHILYGDGVADRTPEIRALRRYWAWLGEIYPEQTERRLLMGDFNLPPDHPAWAPLKEVARPAPIAAATTLSSTDGAYASRYDHLWLPRRHRLAVTGQGVLRFPELLAETSGRPWRHEAARAHVSDHAPVYVLLDGAELHPAPQGPLHPPGDPQAPAATAAADCIDLNRAGAQRLQALPHIGPERAAAVVAGRPWSGVAELERIDGIGPARRADIAAAQRVCE